MSDIVKQEITPASLVQVAIEKGADIDKLQQLMQMQIEWEAHEAKKSYVKAMSAFRAECPAIERTKKAHNSMYAGLAESIEVIKPFMAKHGLSHSWRTEQVDGNIRVECTVTHIEGHSEKNSLMAGPDTTGSKNSIQAIGSTTAYLQRYTLFPLLGLASKDQDKDGNLPKELPLLTPDDEKKWPKALETAAKDGGLTWIKSHYNVPEKYMEELEKCAPSMT